MMDFETLVGRIEMVDETVRMLGMDQLESDDRESVLGIVIRLLRALERHHSLTGHDRCHEEDDLLYQLAGLKPRPRDVLPIDEHRRECDRYRACKFGVHVEDEPYARLTALEQQARDHLAKLGEEADVPNPIQVLMNKAVSMHGKELSIGKTVYWLDRSCSYDENNRRPWQVEGGMVVSFDERTVVVETGWNPRRLTTVKRSDIAVVEMEAKRLVAERNA